jgi:hypothetical protein
MKLPADLENLWESLQVVKKGSIDQLVGAVEGELNDAESERSAKQGFQHQIAELLRKKEAEVRKTMKSELEQQQSNHMEITEKELEAAHRKSKVDRLEALTRAEEGTRLHADARDQQHQEELAALRANHKKELARQKLGAAEEQKKVLDAQREADFAIFVGTATGLIGECACHNANHFSTLASFARRCFRVP